MKLLALDPQTTKAILKLLEEVNKQLGITIIIITHQMEVVKDICDRVAIMDMGEVVETGQHCRRILKPKETVTKSFYRDGKQYKQGLRSD